MLFLRIRSKRSFAVAGVVLRDGGKVTEADWAKACAVREVDTAVRRGEIAVSSKPWPGSEPEPEPPEPKPPASASRRGGKKAA